MQEETTALRLLSSDAVAKVLGVSVHRVRQLAAEGVLQPVRFSEAGRLRFRVEDVEALVLGKTPVEQHWEEWLAALAAEWVAVADCMDLAEPGWRANRPADWTIEAKPGRVFRFRFGDRVWSRDPVTGRIVEERADPDGGLAVRVLSPTTGEVVSGGGIRPTPQAAESN
jgi:hypothetical protein